MTTSFQRRRALFAGTALLATVALMGAPVAAQDPLRAAYVSSGPIGVNPFLQLIQQGLEEGGAATGVETNVVESTDASAIEENLRVAIEDGYDLIVANSFESVEAVTKLAGEYPDQKWALVDTTVDAPNVRGLVFKEHEGAYLVGAILGLLATGEHEGYPASEAIGAVGAIDLPFIRRWLVGFQEGVRAVNPDVALLEGWGNSFNDPATSKELALAQADQGAQYIFAFAAAGNFGIFEGARERGFFTTGVDTDQRGIDPAHILESVVKRTDVGVVDAVEDLAAGAFSGGIAAYGLAENGVGPAFLILDAPDPAVTLPQAVQDQVRALADQIIGGRVVVTDYLAQPAS